MATGFPEDKKRELLKKLYWDKNIDIDYILKLLEGGREINPGDRTDLYCRLLTTYDWYTLLKLVSIDRLGSEVLDDVVLSRLFPDALRKKYQYARRVLSGQIVSSSG